MVSQILEFTTLYYGQYVHAIILLIQDSIPGISILLYCLCRKQWIYLNCCPGFQRIMLNRFSLDGELFELF